MNPDDHAQAQLTPNHVQLNREAAGWRQRLIQQMLLVGLILGAVIYAPSILRAIPDGKWGLVAIDTIALATFVYLYFNQQLAYSVRATICALVLYVLGAWLLGEVGSVSQTYLLGFSITATLLLGLRFGLFSVALNALTFLLFWMVDLVVPSMAPVGREMSASTWIVVTMNFLFINLLLVIAIGVVLKTLENLMQREHEARVALEQERAELVQANEALDREIRERKLLEAQLVQSQKMEAIGQLAGGVAHDFNNLLTIINGYSDVLLASLAADSDTDTQFMVTEIQSAGDRAAALTRQLLAFSRKQMLAPQVLDLNLIVAGVEKILRRLIGEDITITVIQAPNLARITVDPSQLEQVLLNLAVNARDAMPAGGQLTIETANLLLSAETVARKFEIKPGAYVALTVSDTGCGMAPEVQNHIFEPFFTTKAVGKGTGLGLATVFGIVKQSGGFIDVYSEEGVGTRFRVLFPAVDASTADEPVPEGAVRVGNETVLLVEDEAGVRTIARMALEAHGYHVLEAANGQEALRLFEQREDGIDLLLTDVVMPGMSGRELVEQVRRRNPGLRVLFMSGYTDDAIVRHGIIDATDAFLQKPFAPVALARKVQQTLHPVASIGRVSGAELLDVHKKQPSPYGEG